MCLHQDNMGDTPETQRECLSHDQRRNLKIFLLNIKLALNSYILFKLFSPEKRPKNKRNMKES